MTLLFVLLVASIMLLFTVSVYYLYEQFRQQEFRQRLEEKAVTTVRLREDVGEVPQNDLPVLADEQVTVYNQRGQVQYSHQSQLPRFPIPANFLRTISEQRASYLRVGDVEAVGVYYQRPGTGPLYIVASANDRYGLSKLVRLREILFFGWLLSLLIVGVAGYLFATDALRPVAELITQANTISATSIHKRLSVGRQRDELADLARTFNAMLTRLEDAFVIQKSFVSHASHELRTPLTVMMGQIEVTRLHPRSNTDYELALDALLDEVKSMIRLTYQIAIDFETLPDQEDDLIVLGESSLLQTAFQNLMENGCKYSADHSVSVRIRAQTGQVHLTISDKGHGIAADALPHVFDPFFRADPTATTEGHGIGLALTQRIIELHQGLISVESAINKGTTFQITLPSLQLAVLSQQ